MCSKIYSKKLSEMAGLEEELFRCRRAHAVQAAAELGYSRDVMERVAKAETAAEIERAMICGRHDTNYGKTT